jgi:putative flavoprotein involved in K+ transport
MSAATLVPTPRVERYDVVVIGGGQAGLATAQQLMRRNLDVVVLEAAAHIGDTWRHRWDSLRLFTPAAYDGLPDMPFPAPSNHLPDKDEVAAYLERYVEQFDLDVRLNTRVERMTREFGVFRAYTASVTYEAPQVVVSTGPFQRPRIPDIATLLDPSVHQLHSSAYRNPFSLPEGPVLVVGAGNSGAQIALELAQLRKVWLAGPDTGHMPRRVLGRDVFDWIWPMLSVAHTERRVGRALREKARQSADSLIGIPEATITRAGIQRLERVSAVRGGMPVCGTTVVRPAAIVWATGFTSDYSWIELPVCDERGNPRHHRGIAHDVEGLAWVGLRFQHRMTSSLLGGVGVDATYIAEQFAARVGQADAA